MNKTKIVIIGGGFGGVYTARNLYRLYGDTAEITLINKQNYFLFTPLLHEVATGSLTPDSVMESLREIFLGTSVTCVEDTVNSVDRTNKVVTTTNSSYKYDYLVVSTGAETNYFGIAGAQENSLTLKNVSDAILLRNHIIDTLEKSTQIKNTNKISFAIIGAGATGVELSAEIIEYARSILKSFYSDSLINENDIEVILITNTPQIISVFPEKMRILAQSILEKKGVNIITNATVTKVEKGLITFSDQTTLTVHTVIWVAGVKPSLSSISGITIGPKGRMEVNEYLQSLEDQNIFGLGDSSGIHPMLAQIAVQQAVTVANNIYAHNNGSEPSKFDTKIKGLLISLGKWNALGDIKGYTLNGPFMWFIWRTVYLFNYNSWKKRFEVAFEWVINLFIIRDITYLK
jgi:NADH dehydrogenase